MTRETKDVLDLMYEALEPVPFNLLTPPELSVYSENDLLNMVKDILAQPKELTSLDRACLVAIGAEFQLRDAQKGQLQ